MRREADANTYDNNGNVTSQTDAEAPTYNLLANASFEFADAYGNPTNWYKSGDASFVLDNTVSMAGNKSIKISSINTTNSYLYQWVDVAGGDKLTLSASARFQNAYPAVDVGLEYYDINYNYLGAKYAIPKGGTGNDKYVLTDATPVGTAHVAVILEMWGGNGTVWFDAVQLEKPIVASEGHILTKFDYVDNSSFENDMNYWPYSSGAVVTTESAWGGIKSVKLSTSGNYAGTPFIPILGGQPLTISAFIKTNNLTGTGAYVQTDFYDASYNYVGTDSTTKQTGTQDFTRIAKVINPPANAANVVIYAMMYSTSGTSYFDNIKLIPSSTTTFKYDAGGNSVTDVYDPLNNWTSLTYDGSGNRTSIKDPKGKTTTFSYDGANDLTTVTDAKGKIFRFGFDPVSLQVAYRDGRSTSDTDNTYKTTFGYNELNQVTSITDPLGRQITNTYDVAGNVYSTTFPNSKQVIYSYDNANRLTQKRYSADTNQYNLTYDTANNLKQVTDNLSRNYTYNYDKGNRITSIADIFGYTQNFGLDNSGNTTTITDSKGKTISYGYNSANRLQTLTDTTGRTTNFHYTEDGKVFEVVKGNGINIYNTYDFAGRVAQTTSEVNGTWMINDHYAYDANGNITADGYTVNGYNQYAYDDLNRLTSWTNSDGITSTYSYDAVGNLTQKDSKTFTYNAANEITNTGYTYDTNGNMISDGNKNYTYNTENQLVQVKKVSDGSTVATYEYDYRGLRISKTVSGVTTRFHYDDKERLIRESDTNNNTIAQYMYDDNDQLQAIEKGGQIYYTHYNYRGDIQGLTDATGQKIAWYSYTPWGEIRTSLTNDPINQSFRYAGYYYDSETGMYYLKARYYSPDLGRFVTKDTFKGFNDDPQSLNLYAYANGNPVMNVDPSGHIAINFGFDGYIRLDITSRWAQIALNITPGMLINLGIGIAVGAYIGTAVKAFLQGVFVKRIETIVGIWVATQISKQLLKMAAKKEFGYLAGGTNWLKRTWWYVSYYYYYF